MVLANPSDAAPQQAARGPSAKHTLCAPHTPNANPLGWLQEFEGRWSVTQLPSRRRVASVYRGVGAEQGSEEEDGDLQQVEEACYVEHELSIKPLLPLPPPIK